MHQKVILIDQEVAGIGTANMDNRSFRLNFEITAMIMDRQFASRVEHMLEADFARSRRMQHDEYRQKPFWFRLAVRAARLTSPLQ